MNSPGGPDRTWTVEQCAAAWDIKPATWRAYVASGHAPRPLPGYDAQRRRRWDPAVVRDYPRPGRGARTDLDRLSLPTVTNVDYPHRDESLLYPESAELREGAVRTIAAILDDNSDLPSAELAQLIDARLRATWQMSADVLDDSTEIRIGAGGLRVIGRPYRAGWRTDTGALHGISLDHVHFEDATGARVTVATRPTSPGSYDRSCENTGSPGATP